MKTYNVIDYGLCPDGETPNSDALSVLINSLPDNSTLLFPSGRYYFPKNVIIKNKKRLTLQGDGAVLITHFEPCGDPAYVNELFNFYDCEDIVLSDFVITTDNQIGWSGAVKAVNTEQLYYDVEIYEQFEVTGFEHPIAVNTCDSDGTPDYLFGNDVWREEETVIVNGEEKKRFGGHYYDVIGKNLCRFKAGDAKSLKKLRVGEQVCYRFFIYGCCDISLNSVKRALLKNINIQRASGMALVISGRSRDVTLENFNLKAAVGSKELYASNADGIHINGLGGYLKMKNCEFVGLGDDALNVHSVPGEISKVLNNGEFDILQPYFNNFAPPKYAKLPEYWAEKGDVIEVYNKVTFEKTGELTVESYSDGKLKVSRVQGEPADGNLLINTAFCPSVSISDCTVKNTRARGLLIRTRDVTIENCFIYGISLPAILITPDIVVWHEVGNSRNVLIKNNTFEKCAIIESPANRGAIAIKSCDDDANNIDYRSYVHSDIKILNNKFINIANSAVYASATKGLTVAGNSFENCCNNPHNNTEQGIRYDIFAENCADVSVFGNTTTQNAEKLFMYRSCSDVND